MDERPKDAYSSEQSKYVKNITDLIEVNLQDSYRKDQLITVGEALQSIRSNVKYTISNAKHSDEVKEKAQLLYDMAEDQRSVRTKLRNELKAFLKEELSHGDFSYFISNLVNNKIPAIGKKKLKKVYPVRDVSVRSIFLVGDKVEDEVVVKEEEAKPAEAPEVAEQKPVAEETS